MHKHDRSASKGTCCQAGPRDFHPRDPYCGRRKQRPQIVLGPAASTPWHVHTHTLVRARINGCNKEFFKKKGKEKLAHRASASASSWLSLSQAIGSPDRHGGHLRGFWVGDKAPEGSQMGELAVTVLASSQTGSRPNRN